MFSLSRASERSRENAGLDHARPGTLNGVKREDASLVTSGGAEPRSSGRQEGCAEPATSLDPSVIYLVGAVIARGGGVR